jgi:hypothetical protein
VKPFISIAIPTRNRPELARMCVNYLLAQDYENFEIIVLDNSDDANLLSCEWADPRCRVIPATSVLPMPENWERAITAAEGEYLIILSDKDMILTGALTRISDALLRTKAGVVSFRKAASFASASESFIQSCTGKLIEVDFALVARAWFENVQHMHDAPMIYNSAVRLDLLREISKHAGKFFIGSGPDVASSILLAGSIGNYVLIDRPLVVSLYGPWSIGSATNKGRQGAAAKWLAEFGDDPLLQAGVIHGVTGVIAETLIACKKAHEDLLRPYAIKWPAYVRGALWELDTRRSTGVDTREAQIFLASSVNRPYSIPDLLLGVARYFWEKVASSSRSRLRRGWSKLVGPNRPVTNVLDIASDPIEPEIEGSYSDVDGYDVDGYAHIAEKYFRRSSSVGSPYRDVPYVRLSRNWKLDDVMSLGLAINEMLDGVISDELPSISA